MFNGMMMAGRPIINANVIISGDQTNWVLIDEVFGGTPPVGPASVVITVEAGVAITTMDLTGLPDGSSIRLINEGMIFGLGGGGGRGGNVFMETDQ